MQDGLVGAGHLLGQGEAEAEEAQRNFALEVAEAEEAGEVVGNEEAVGNEEVGEVVPVGRAAAAEEEEELVELALLERGVKAVDHERVGVVHGPQDEWERKASLH